MKTLDKNPIFLINVFLMLLLLNSGNVNNFPTKPELQKSPEPGKINAKSSLPLVILSPEILKTFPYTYQALLLSGEIILANSTIGLSSSKEKTDWLTKENDSLCMNYPSEEQWGAVWITPTQGINEDFSKYSTILVELRGEKGGESVEIKLKDKSGKEYKFPLKNLPKTWKNYKISRKNMTDTTSFLLADEPQTVCVRRLEYLTQ